MGSNPNFKSFGNHFAADGMGNGGGNGSQPPGNFPLARQSSVYSLTFEEFQNSMGGIGKDFGSMNMDELLKNIWSAEENQTMQTATTAAVGGVSASAVGGGGRQEGIRRQGSLTLPRTLSQRTVDEVWKDISKEYGSGNDTGGTNMPQRQQTLGEVTLEEFLLRAGVVREEAQLAAKVNGNSDFFGDLSRTGNNPGMGLGFQHNKIVGLSGNGANQMPVQASNLPLNVNGVRSNEPQPQQQQQQPILPKQPNVGYPSQMPLQTSPGIRSRIMGMGDQGISSGLVQGGGMGMVGLGMVGTGSPANQLSSDGVAKSNGETSSVSPVPYVFSGGVRGRRATGTIEKVVERRQRRMIKNRESAARSRARKQAYTMELEAEVAKLKEENQQLRKKQEEIMEMQKNQAMEMMHMQRGGEKRRLRRTQTGPW